MAVSLGVHQANESVIKLNLVGKIQPSHIPAPALGTALADYDLALLILNFLNKRTVPG